MTTNEYNWRVSHYKLQFTFNYYKKIFLKLSLGRAETSQYVSDIDWALLVTDNRASGVSGVLLTAMQSLSQKKKNKKNTSNQIRFVNVE